MVRIYYKDTQKELVAPALVLFPTCKPADEKVLEAFPFLTQNHLFDVYEATDFNWVEAGGNLDSLKYKKRTEPFVVLLLNQLVFRAAIQYWKTFQSPQVQADVERILREIKPE